MSKKRNWFVANDKGEIIGHDLSEQHAKLLAAEMNDKEPGEGWEALSSDEDNNE